jgi:hypothetical protein
VRKEAQRVIAGKLCFFVRFDNADRRRVELIADADIGFRNYLFVKAERELAVEEEIDPVAMATLTFDPGDDHAEPPAGYTFTGFFTAGGSAVFAGAG